MSIINMKPEAVELVNRLCDPGNLEERIIAIEGAEDQLQKMAYDQSEPLIGYDLYEIAFTLKIYRKELQELKTLLENGKAEGRSSQEPGD
jgi:hypothetical protein